MNAHIPQSYEASTELEDIAAVPHQIITPRHAKPIIGVVQDTLVGAYRLTRPNQFSLREYMNLMMWNKRFDGQIEAPRAGTAAAPRWTGHQVLSTLLPPLNLEMPNTAYDDNKVPENYIKIREGNVGQGVFDKDIFAKPSKGIIHTTYNDYGPKDTVQMIDALQNTIEHYLILNGFSVGISDLIADEATKKNMETIIQERKKEIEDILLQVHLDLFDNNTGKTNQEEFESRVFSVLDKATNLSGKAGQASLAEENRMMAMVRAGSKGGAINIAQMVACVGQQAIDGKRIPYGFTDRTLPHYKKYDDGAEARGFVESSFIRGLTPQEFFFHAMSGREGLIDTAVKTADTGYIQRQLVKGMEDITVQHDGTVRDGNMNIIQFYYGEDGVNATRIESQSLPLGKMSVDDVRREFGLAEVDMTSVLAEGTEAAADPEKVAAFVEQILADRALIVEKVFNSGSQGAVQSPVNIERLILNLKIRYGFTPESRTDLTVDTVIDGIERIIGQTQPHNKVWAALLRFHLAPHRIILKERFNRSAFDLLCETIIVKNMQGWAQPGELVGIVAAQSIGEPSTQMSSLKSTVITVKNSAGENFRGSIGTYIDALLEKHKSSVVSIGNDSVVLDLPAGEASIVGVSEDERVSWRAISQVSRHPANGGLVKVHTRSGRSTTATLSHSFLRRSRNGIVPILGSELREGMRIPVARLIPTVDGAATTVTYEGTTFELDKDFGWLCGMYLADGSISGNRVCITKLEPVIETKLREISDKYGFEFSTRMKVGEYGPGKDNYIHSTALKGFLNANFGTGSYEKRIGSLAFTANRAFIAGLLGGYFDGDGNVNGPRQLIRASSRNEALLTDIASLFGYVGMFSTLGSETSVNYPGQVQHTLTLTKKYAAAYKEEIGFVMPEKAAALDEIIEYENRTDKHDVKQNVDMIPELGDVIADVGKALKIPGHSRNYGRWRNKEAIGRETLRKYYRIFLGAAFEQGNAVTAECRRGMEIIKSALDADVVWDEIVRLEYLADPKEYVYDFTVPGNDSFMVDCNVLVHNTLNTFHLAGVASKSNVTRGVPRLKELLKVTQNPKATSLTIYMKPEYRELKEKAREVAQDLELTLLRDITLKTAIYYEPSDDATIIQDDAELLEFYKLFEAAAGEDTAGAEKPKSWSPWMLRLELNREKMFNKNISMDDVAFVLRDKFPNVNMVYSDYNSTKLVMRIRYFQEDGEDVQALKKFQNRLLNGIVIRGVPGIKGVTFRMDKEKVVADAGEYKKLEQYILDTDGSNFLEVANHPAVDGNRLYSTNVHDIYEHLGIEAARAGLLQEITGLFDEVGVNQRHLGLLCDIMTRPGRFVSMDRYGINKLDIGPLAKASFEETEKILLKASLFGEVDPVVGVSANIMIGQPIRGGTNFTQILLDEQALPKMLARVAGRMPTIEEEEAGLDYYGIEKELADDVNDPCGVSKFQVMRMAMPSAYTMLDEPDMEMVVV